MLPFDASASFSFDKAAGVACPNLDATNRCRIHDELAVRGCSGCAAYDCYGAGPRVVRMLARAPHRARADAFFALRPLHELLFLLLEAQKLCPVSHGGLTAELMSAVAALDEVVAGPMAAILEADVGLHHDRAKALLLRVGHAIGGREGLRRRLAVIE